MPRRLSCDPSAEIFGGSVLALIKMMNYDEIVDVLEKHHLTEVDPDQWYPLQLTLDIISEVADRPNAPVNLVSLGMMAAELGIQRLPPEKLTLTVEEALRLYGDEIYPARHRGGDVGKIWVEHVDDSHCIVHAQVPYPADQVYGIMYGYARHFRPEGKSVVLEYDPDLPRHDEGGDETLIHVYIQ